MTTTGRPGRALDDLVVRDRSWPKIASNFDLKSAFMVASSVRDPESDIIIQLAQPPDTTKKGYVLNQDPQFSPEIKVNVFTES